MADSGAKSGLRGILEGIKGKFKEATGAVADNEHLRREGRAQQDKADAEREAAKRETQAARARAEAQVHEARQAAHEER
ncbi:MAG TPA: CsbD family protein [Acidimicrobiales bacterium]|jgi:uncharacterized protein YjbJ (UPF0337 family)|nr:CsbD family protein [Acidimicrobiales bacterium]